MSLFEKIANSVMPHPQNAQMVLGLGPSGPGLEKSLKILASCGAGWSRRESGSSSAEAVLVISAPVPACQEAVIKLTENGFKKLQAVYPPDSKGFVEPKS
jgi:hypothetical protein